MIGIPFLEFLGNLKGVGLDDVVDRLNYIFTSILLLLFATIVTAKQVQPADRPITCMIDAEFPSKLADESLELLWLPRLGHWVDYVNEYCFKNATYYLPSQDPTIPGRKVDVSYYQVNVLKCYTKEKIILLKQNLTKIFDILTKKK